MPSPRCCSYYHARTMGEWGVGTDAVSALDCWGFDMPGFQGMKLAAGLDSRAWATRPPGYEDTGGSLRLHFPDGNATIARLLVQRPHSGGLAGAARQARRRRHGDRARRTTRSSTAAGAPVRLRLNSTAIRARHLGEPESARQVEVTYLRGGPRLQRTRARRRCWRATT